MAKRPTRAEQKNREYSEGELYEPQFLREMASATTLEEISKLADRPVSKGKSRYHHWLGCALHHNPYDSAPAHVASAIQSAVERIRQTQP